MLESHGLCCCIFRIVFRKRVCANSLWSFRWQTCQDSFLYSGFWWANGHPPGQTPTQNPRTNPRTTTKPLWNL